MRIRLYAHAYAHAHGIVFFKMTRIRTRTRTCVFCKIKEKCTRTRYLWVCNNVSFKVCVRTSTRTYTHACIYTRTRICTRTQVCRELHQYNALKAILAALQSASVTRTRLKKTWEVCVWLWSDLFMDANTCVCMYVHMCSYIFAMWLRHLSRASPVQCTQGHSGRTAVGINGQDEIKEDLGGVWLGLSGSLYVCNEIKEDLGMCAFVCSSMVNTYIYM